MDYLQIEKLFGTPLSNIPIQRSGLSTGQVILIVVVGSFALYGAYTLFKDSWPEEDKRKSKIPNLGRT